jgi:hypothetical protein
MSTYGNALGELKGGSTKFHPGSPGHHCSPGCQILPGFPHRFQVQSHLGCNKTCQHLTVPRPLSPCILSQVAAKSHLQAGPEHDGVQLAVDARGELAVRHGRLQQRLEHLDVLLRAGISTPPQRPRSSAWLPGLTALSRTRIGRLGFGHGAMENGLGTRQKRHRDVRVALDAGCNRLERLSGRLWETAAGAALPPDSPIRQFASKQMPERDMGREAGKVLAWLRHPDARRASYTWPDPR